jgi:sulfur relay (sulfurtransferase) DsrF/TusC family protein
MNFNETIQLQALRLKQSFHGSDPQITEHFIEEAARQNPEALPMKNICAFVSQQLFDRVNGCCDQLSLSKRRFVEMALIEALDRAEAIVSEVNPYPGEEH